MHMMHTGGPSCHVGTPPAGLINPWGTRISRGASVQCTSNASIYRRMYLHTPSNAALVIKAHHQQLQCACEAALRNRPQANSSTAKQRMSEKKQAAMPTPSHC